MWEPTHSTSITKSHQIAQRIEIQSSMEYRKLGHSDIHVSAIGLGTMTWGEQNTQQQAFEQLDYALDAGVNFIDTAELYSVPPKADTYGATETIIGNWLAQRGQRDRVILASKVAGPSDDLTYMRGECNRFTRDHILNALENSLQRLQTEYLDLYQLHWPDRNTNFFGQLGYQHFEKETATPILETLEVLSEIQQSGKVRYFGLSNETPWGVMQFLQLAKEHNHPMMVSVQNPYNLLNRTFEIGLAEIAHREQQGLLAYSPLAFGTLTGKYLNQQKPANARLTLFDRFSRYNNKEAVSATERYVTLAKLHGISPTQMALAFVTSRSFTTSNIIGATTLEQLKENIESIHLTLNKEVLKGIETIHQQQPNPSP